MPMQPAKEVRPEDVEMAKLAVFWDDDADNSLVYEIPASNDPETVEISDDELRQMRQSMKKYEREAADIGEDEAFYRGRFRLQFLETE